MVGQITENHQIVRDLHGPHREKKGGNSLMYLDSDKSVQCWKRMHFNHSCFCCNEKAFTEENFQGGIIQILIHTYVKDYSS